MPARHPIANKRKRQPDRRPRELPRGVHSRSITVGIYLLLTGLSLAVFSQTIHYNFVNFDDDMYVYNAPAIQAGLTLKGIAAAFTSPHAGNWHPLTTLSHMLDCGLYGLNAGGHHATNVVLHTIAALLLFHVLRQMTGAFWKSAIVAALFAVHPLHVESVAWVSERKDVLSAVFFFLMLDAYVRYARAATITRYLVVTALFVAGLMSKPMLVTAPIVLLLLDYWPLRRFEQIVLHKRESENPAVRQSKAHNTTAFSGKDSLAHPFRRRRYRHICAAKTLCWRASSAAVSLAGGECGHELRHLRLENIVADAPRRFLSSSK